MIKEDREKCIFGRTAAVQSLVLFFLMLVLLSAKVRAAEASGDPDQDAEMVTIRVEGAVEETDRQALLDRLNAIRIEACREGVRNPSDGVPMTPEDYMPLQWSFDLEKIAVLRAAESTILQDHTRPDGTGCFTAAPDGVPYTMETLAWGFGSASAAVEGWYSEKSSYVGETGRPAGHYMALINPENRYVGIADLKAEWQRDACAGAFGPQGEAGDLSVIVSGNGTTEWDIPLRRDLLGKVIERAVEITAIRIHKAGVFR